MFNRDIFDILVFLEENEPGALKKIDNKGIRIMVRNKLVICQDESFIRHRVNDDGLIDIYCLNCGKYITSTYEDFIRKYQDKWDQRKKQMKLKHDIECETPSRRTYEEVAFVTEEEDE